MITFEVQIDTSSCSHGWATVIVRAKDRVLKIECSHLGGDSIRELAGAFGHLAEGEHRKVEIDCYEEPGNSLIGLKRVGDDLEVVIKRFRWKGDGAPQKIIDRARSTHSSRDWRRMEHARNREASLRQTGLFVEAMKSLATSLQHVEDNIDSEQYERAWGFAFPTAELTAMWESLSRRSTDGDRTRG